MAYAEKKKKKEAINSENLPLGAVNSVVVAFLSPSFSGRRKKDIIHEFNPHTEETLFLLSHCLSQRRWGHRYTFFLLLLLLPCLSIPSFFDKLDCRRLLRKRGKEEEEEEEECRNSKFSLFPFFFLPLFRKYISIKATSEPGRLQ